MIERGLKGVCLVVGDRCAGLVATVGSMLPKAKYQRCMVHFMRNVLSKTPPTHREWSTRRYLDMSRLDDILVEAN